MSAIEKFFSWLGESAIGEAPEALDGVEWFLNGFLYIVSKPISIITILAFVIIARLYLSQK